MRLSIKAKQIAGVTVIVGVAVVALSALYATRLSDVVLQEHYSRGRLLANAILHRAREVARVSDDPYAALRMDPGLLASLQSSLYSDSVVVAAIVDPSGVVVASNDNSLIGRSMPRRPLLSTLVNANLWNQLRVIYSAGWPDVRGARTAAARRHGAGLGADRHLDGAGARRAQ